MCSFFRSDDSGEQDETVCCNLQVVGRKVTKTVGSCLRVVGRKVRCSLVALSGD
jgi:hypothetical protein